MALASFGAHSYADTVVSNLSKDSKNNAVIGTSPGQTTPRHQGTAFTTGDDSYKLKSVKARFGYKRNNPEYFQASLYTNNSSNLPGSKIVDLSGSTPDSANDYTYTCSGSSCDLAANTTYHLVFSANSSSSNNYCSWSITDSFDQDQTPSGNGWTIANTMSVRLSNIWYNVTWRNYVGSFSVSAVKLPVLTASDATPTSLKLTIANHSGNWYYKYTTPSGGSCSAIVSGTTVTVSSLDSNTSYTFKAYSDIGCSTELATAAAASTLVELTASDATPTSVKLTIPNYSENWYYKYTTPSGGSCSAVVSGTTTTATGLQSNVAYIFKAYSDSACSSLVATAAIVITPQPVTLTASAVEDDTATLSIANHSGAWYYKYTGPTDGSCSSSAVGSGTTTANLTGLSGGTSYTYKTYGDSSCRTELTSDATDVDFLTKPGQVSGVSVTAGNTSLAVSWTAVTGTVTGYKVQWKSGNEEYNETRQKTVTSGASTTITGLTNATAYTVRVTAYNTTGDGAASTEATGTPVAPAAVGLSGSGVEATTATLSIVNHSGAWYYKKTIPTGDNTCTAVSSGTTASLTGLNEGTSYTYKAYSDTSCGTELTSATTDADFLTKPAQVSGVSVTAGNTSLAVSWTAVTGTVTGYKVQWKSGNEEYNETRQKTVTSGASTTITSLTNNTTYTVRVTAYNTTGDGAASTEVTGTPVAPAAVSLSSSAVEATTATLSIVNHSGAWYYKKTVPTGDNTCTAVSSGTTASLTGLTAGTSYTYKAYSDTSCGTELTSATTDADFLTKPAQVSGVSVTAGSTSLAVSWTAVTGYKVQWKSGSEEYNSGDRQKTVTSGASTTITSLTNNTTYTVRVTAYNTTGDGEASTEVTGTPVAPAAVSLSSSAVEATTATLSIVNHSGAWYYNRTVPTGDNTCTAVSSGTTASLTGLTAGTSYTYKAYRDTSCATELTSATTDADFLTKPAQVSGVSITAGNTSLAVSWTAVTGTVTGYKVQWKSGNEEYNSGDRQKTVTSGTTTTITGLTNATAYTVRVTAYNGTGDGEVSAEVTGTLGAVTLTTSDVMANSLKLTIANYAGDWYYKYTTPNGG